MTEQMFIGYLHGAWIAEPWWEIQYFRKQWYTGRWLYLIGWAVGRQKRRDIHE